MNKKIKIIHPDMEDVLMSLRNQQAQSDKEYTKQFKLLRKRLKHCAHKYIEPMEWEWDDGYGQQKTIKGEHCLSCLKERAWAGTGSWSKVEDHED